MIKLKELFGEDILTVALKLVFEFLFYLLSASLGAIIRETGKDKSNFKKTVGDILLTSCTLFVLGTWLKSKFQDSRLIFGIGILLCIAMPKVKKLLFTQKGVGYLVGLFNENLGKALDKANEEEEEEDEKKKGE